MKLKIFVWILAVFLLNSLTSAVVNDSKGYWSLDASYIDVTNVIDSSGYKNGTLYGAYAVNETGKLGQAINISKAGEGRIQIATNAELGTFICSGAGCTIAAWIKLNNTVPAEQHIFSKDKITDRGYYLDILSGGGLRFYCSPDGVASAYSDTAVVLTTGVWTHVAAVYNAANATPSVVIYINGTARSTTKTGTYGAACNVANNATLIGANSYLVGYALNGTIDEVAFYDTAKSATDIATLYYNGTGYNPYAPAAFNFTITSIDEFNSSTITTFNALIDETEYNTTTGILSTPLLINSTTLHNITLYTANYLNKTYLNYNVSGTPLSSTLHQAELCLNATSKVSGSYITPNNFTIGSTTRTSCFNISAGSHNVMAQKTGWYSKNQSFTIAALSNTTRTVENMSSSLANITVYYSNGTKISNWNINITSNDYPSWPAENGSTSSGSYNFSGINGTYTAIVTDVVGTETFTFTLNAYTQNINFYHFGIDNCTAYHVPTINFTIWNEETAALLNNSALNIYLEITSSYYPGNKTYNFSFSTGNYYALCVPNNTITGWTAYAQAEYSNLPNYDEKNYFLVNYNLSNTSANIDLYLAYNTSQLKLKVRDYTDQGISNAYIKVLSYDLGTNSYKTTEIVKSDSSGDAYAEIIPNIQWYAFIVEYNGRIYLQTLPTKITTSELTLRISLTSDYFTNYNIVAGIANILFYNNATSTFSFTYDDPTGNVQQGCMQVTERNAFRDSVLNTTCVNSSASTILISIAGVAGNFTYIASSYAMIDGISIPLNSTSVNLNTTYKMFGALGWLITFLLVITLILVGCWHPSVAIVLAVFGIIASVIMNFIYVTWTSIVVLVIIGAIALYRVGNKPN